MYELIMRTEKKVTMSFDVYSADFAEVVALGRENGVSVKLCSEQVFYDMFDERRFAELYSPVIVTGLPEDVEDFCYDLWQRFQIAA